MSYTVVSNDTRATKVTAASQHEMREASGGSNAPMKVFFDEIGLVAEIGRGESDPNITYFAAYNTNLVLCYIYPNAAGTGIIVSATKP